MQIRWTTRRSVAVLALFMVLCCALCISMYRVFGNFWDEPEHLAAGLVLLDRGEYRYDVQHPPLARLAAAIGPYLAGARIQGEPLPIGEAEQHSDRVNIDGDRGCGGTRNPRRPLRLKNFA